MYSANVHSGQSETSAERHYDNRADSFIADDHLVYFNPHDL